ncbi:MAG TPA: GMC family oxidoreductase [Steroidobacteraceae bacterium]|jgi:choline dehydrogenase-like flavoprotein|nr:GMC family oxidoreductase [Steroidobacteraceae bacterium]
METNSFDAIVVGSGMSGGWAAKELTEKGLKTLVLERGRMVRHGEYPTATKDPWELPYGNRITQETRHRKPVQTRTGYPTPANQHWFVDDLDNPYVEASPFDWLRGYHVGGRSLMWARQSYRFGPLDFEANAKEGVGVPWPVTYDEIAPWYDKVEIFAGISGSVEGLPQLPDGKYLPPFDLNCVEVDFKKRLDEKMGRKLIIGRCANLTAPLTHNESPQRGTCQRRNLCIRGCPFGGYFSSVSSTLPSAERTGNMTLLPNQIVYEIIYDNDKGKATGVRVLDAETGKQTDYFAKVIFLNASALGSAFVMMNSVSSRFPNGFGNDSGELGHNIMDHNKPGNSNATVEGYLDEAYTGRRPNGFYIPRYRNVGKDKRDYLRGFGYQGRAARAGYGRFNDSAIIGEELKKAVQEPGPWNVSMTAFGEILPYHENHAKLDRTKKDKYGLPQLVIDAVVRDNERRMEEDMKNDAAEMLEAAGYKNVTVKSDSYNVGNSIHESGTARMGADPKKSVLNKFNQVHACKNVFVTDGSFLPSFGCQNPSLTYMAFTARAAAHAVEELNKGNL